MTEPTLKEEMSRRFDRIVTQMESLCIVRNIADEDLVEVVQDLFFMEPDKYRDRSYSEKHVKDFDPVFEDVDLDVMESFANQCLEVGVLSSSEKEKLDLIPSPKVLSVYYSLRGPRPKFIPTSACYWGVLHYLRFVRQKRESARTEGCIKDIIARHNFKPRVLSFQVTPEIGDELRVNNIPYDVFCRYVLRRVVLPHITNGAATSLIETYRKIYNIFPPSTQACLEVLPFCEENVKSVFADYPNAMYRLNKRIENFWVKKIGGLLHA